MIKDKKTSGILFIVFAVLVLLAAWGGARAMVAARPDVSQVKPVQAALPVEVIHPRLVDHTVEVEAMGNVIAARRTELRSQVGGRVIWRHPALETGGRFAEDDILLKIEPEDYEAVLAETDAAYAQSLLNEQLELQRRAVAVEEWRQAGHAAAEGKEALVLREPHLDAARKLVEAAREGVERAKRNLARTLIRAPYDGMVIRSYAEVGSVLMPQSPVAEIVDTSVFYIEAVLSMESLRWLGVTTDAHGNYETPPEVKVQLISGGQLVTIRTGRALRLTGTLTQPGLMAGVVVAVDNPLDDPSGLLPLGAYAVCRIKGKLLEAVHAIPRSAVRDDGLLWCVDAEGRLAFLSPAPVWMDKDSAFFKEGLDEETMVITTALAVAVPGMPVKVLGQLAVGEANE